MTEKQRIWRAQTFNHPDRVPLLYFNKDREQSDIVMVDIQEHFGGPGKDTSEWGFAWEKLDGTMGQPLDTVIKDWAMLDSFAAPPLHAEQRKEKAQQHMASYSGDKYFLASLQLTGFTVMTFLRGFSNVLEELAMGTDEIHALADIVFTFEEELIRIAADSGFDGVAFFDDWGLQAGMIISPNLWRSFFKPRYQQQFDLAHSLGLDVYFHSCGDILPIIPDLHEIGTDMLNISQPDCYDIHELGRLQEQLKQCFVMPVSYQTTSLTGTRDEIFADVALLIEQLGVRGGGLIGYIEEYSSMGMSDENYKYCVEAFLELGKYDS